MYLRDELQKVIVVAICSGDRPYEYSHLPEDGNGLGDYSRYLAKGLRLAAFESAQVECYQVSITIGFCDFCWQESQIFCHPESRKAVATTTTLPAPKLGDCQYP